MDRDAYVSVFSTKTSGWRGLKIIIPGNKQVTKEMTDLSEIMMMDSGTTINLFRNPKIITNRKKSEIPIKFLINVGSKIVDKVVYITGSGPK